MRAASDFLLALQLTGAAKRDSLANLQIRLPVVVIGGGLSANLCGFLMTRPMTILRPDDDNTVIGAEASPEATVLRW